MSWQAGLVDATPSNLEVERSLVGCPSEGTASTCDELLRLHLDQGVPLPQTSTPSPPPLRTRGVSKRRGQRCKVSRPAQAIRMQLEELVHKLEWEYGMDMVRWELEKVAVKRNAPHLPDWCK